MNVSELTRGFNGGRHVCPFRVLQYLSAVRAASNGCVRDVFVGGVERSVDILNFSNAYFCKAPC